MTNHRIESSGMIHYMVAVLVMEIRKIQKSCIPDMWGPVFHSGMWMLLLETIVFNFKKEKLMKMKLISW